MDPFGLLVGPQLGDWLQAGAALLSECPSALAGAEEGCL